MFGLFKRKDPICGMKDEKEKGIMKNYKNNNWMILLCIAPILLFIALKLFFPTFAYLSLLGLLICPIAMAFMMYSMNKEKKYDRNEEKLPLNKN